MTPRLPQPLGEIGEGKYFATRLLEKFHLSVYLPSSSAEPWQVWSGLCSIQSIKWKTAPKTEEDYDLIPFKWCLLNIDDTLASGNHRLLSGPGSNSSLLQTSQNQAQNQRWAVCLFQDNLCKGHTRIIYASEKECGGGNKSYFTAQISQLLV